MLGRYRLMLADATHIQPDDPDDLEEIVASRFMFTPAHIEVAKAPHEDWLDFVVHFSFAADSPAELRREVERIIDTCGRNVDVFSVVDDAGKVLLIEEDL